MGEARQDIGLAKTPRLSAKGRICRNGDIALDATITQSSSTGLAGLASVVLNAEYVEIEGYCGINVVD